MASNPRIAPAPALGAEAQKQPWRRAFYTVEQIKQLASISRTTIYREAQAGRLKLSKLAGRTGATDEDFLAWLARAT
jgi:membrane carboxypeptidase/penicillin-binding protein